MALTCWQAETRERERRLANSKGNKQEAGWHSHPDEERQRREKSAGIEQDKQGVAHTSYGDRVRDSK